MSIIDRVMIAYNHRYQITPEMDARIRAELLPFIAGLLSEERHGHELRSAAQPAVKPSIADIPKTDD
jgi:hypothetical protein